MDDTERIQSKIAKAERTQELNDVLDVCDSLLDLIIALTKRVTTTLGTARNASSTAT